MRVFSNNKDTITNNNIKEIINNYVFKKKDICCYDYPNRQKLIEIVYSLYKRNKLFKDFYLDIINLYFKIISLFINYFDPKAFFFALLLNL